MHLLDTEKNLKYNDTIHQLLTDFKKAST